MKKNIWTILLAAVLCAALLPAAAFAQEEEAGTVLEGFVTEILDSGFVLEDVSMGEVMLNTSETTVWDGILIDQELQVGQYVIVQYDGRMTFSLPPQAHADRVGCYVLEGVVGEILEDGVLLTGDMTHGDVIVRMEGGLEHVYVNMPITVYYDGVMALSLPGQVNARHIIVPQLEGVVSAKTDEGFLLTDADGVEYQVFLSEDTLVGELLAVDEDAEETEALEENEVATENEAVEETETADETEVTEEADITDETEAADESETTGETDVTNETETVEEPAAIEYDNGDYVTVYYNGATTRSLPPQLTALEVVVHR